MSRGKDLTKNTLIITVGRISTQFITFLLLPLYTTFLSTEEYGMVDLVTTLVQLLIPMISIMIDQGVFRYLLSCETAEMRKKTISSAFFLLLISSIITIIIYVIIGLFVINQYKLWLLLILISTVFSNLFLQIARGLKRTSDYALGSFVCSVATIILNVFCIVFLRKGTIGMLIATFGGNAICCLFLFFKLSIGQYISIFAIDKMIAKEELKYSFPLVPNQLSLWVINSSDRLIVASFLGASATGILAVSHKIPAIYMTFFNIFQLAWHETGAVHYFDEDRDQFFTDMLKRILSIFTVFCMGIIVVLPLVFNWLVGSSFREAYYNIPIYLIALLFNLVIGLLGVVYVATKKTAEIAKTTMMAALLNIVINVGLIKFIDLYAASISTLIGYFVTMIDRIIDTRKYLHITYDKKQITGISFSIVFCCFFYYLNNRIISLLLFPVFLVFAYVLNKNLLDDAFRMLEERFKLSPKKIILIAVCGLMFVIICGTYIYLQSICST